MNLSDVKLGIDINYTTGEIGGMIGTKAICDIPYSAGFLHINGKVSMSGKEAVITAFDWVEGRRKDFTTLTLRRDGITLTVKPIAGIKDFFPQEAKIGRHPDSNPAVTEPLYSDIADDIASGYFKKLCEEKRKVLEEKQKALMKRSKNNGKVRLPIDQIPSLFASEKELE